MRASKTVKRRSHARLLILGVLALLLTLAGAGIYEAKNRSRVRNTVSEQVHTQQDFGITALKSPTDKNGNGVDDYADILLGARAYVATKPKYKSVYYSGGYPTDGFGVCTDVIWQAFQYAGYSLKDLVDTDIANHRGSYPQIKVPDKNIDFRRVKNLNIFFKRNARSLGTDLDDSRDWNPGDIVVFTNHIAIVSDKRNARGQPYIIHNAGQPVYEEDAITHFQLVAHYRWTK